MKNGWKRRNSAQTNAGLNEAYTLRRPSERAILRAVQTEGKYRIGKNVAFAESRYLNHT